MKPGFISIAVAGAGVALAFLLRALVTRSAGFTITSPNATHFINLNAICFWAVLVITAIASLLLWRKARK
jgi:hypothetical protein